MEILDEKEDTGTEVFVPGNVIEDSTGEVYIVVRAEKYDINYDVEYGGYGVANIKSGQTFLYDSLDDLKRTLMPAIKRTVHGKHTVDFDVKGEE